MHLGALCFQGRKLFLRKNSFGGFHELIRALLGAAALVAPRCESVEFHLLLRREIELRVGLLAIHFAVVLRVRGAAALVLGVGRSHCESRSRYQS